MNFPIAVTLFPFLLAFGFSYWRNGGLMLDGPLNLEGFFEGFLWGILLSMFMAVWYVTVQTVFWFW